MAVHIWKVNSEGTIPDGTIVSAGSAAVLLIFILIFNFGARKLGSYLHKKLTQEITPYVQQSNMSKLGQELPRLMQESGHEVRTFMPRWGTINERRNQLHEVIRLSGMNIIIDDTDHTLIIKVASILSTRMQVYFIDNDDYFHKRKLRADEDGNEYSDNAERAIFYARGVLETVKKLRWKGLIK